MSNISHDYIENYIRGLIPENHGIISEMEHYAKENNVPIVHPEVAQFLRVIIKTKGIKGFLKLVQQSGILLLLWLKLRAAIAR